MVICYKNFKDFININELNISIDLCYPNKR